MVRKTNKRRRGIALLEVVLATGLLTVFAASAFLVANGVVETYGSESDSTRVDLSGRDALQAIEARLRSADASAVQPPGMQAPFSTAVLEYTRGIGFDAGDVDWDDPERLALEPEVGEPVNGVDDDGDGLVDEHVLVWTTSFNLPGQKRTVLCSDVARAYDGEVLGNGQDDNGNQLVDEMGFNVSFEGARANLRLTLLDRQGQGEVRARTYERVILLRNTPEAP